VSATGGVSNPTNPKMGGTTVAKTLRERAVERGGVHVPRSTIDQLLADVDGDTRGEIMDLLTGHPRIAHTVCAEVLNEAFHHVLVRPVNPKQVESWRRAHRQAAAA